MQTNLDLNAGWTAFIAAAGVFGGRAIAHLPQEFPGLEGLEAALKDAWNSGVAENPEGLHPFGVKFEKLAVLPNGENVTLDDEHAVHGQVDRILTYGGGRTFARLRIRSHSDGVIAWIGVGVYPGTEFHQPEDLESAARSMRARWTAAGLTETSGW